MSLRIAARLARRELRGGLYGFRIFLACLILGVAAIAAIGTVRASINAGLEDQGAVLLGGDAEAEFTYRFADETERAWLESVSVDLSEVTDFRSMVVVGEERGLTQVKSVDDNYPLKGSVTLAPEMPLSEALDGQKGLPGSVMHRVLADRMGLSIGDRFKLGSQEFVLSSLLVYEPDSATGGFGLGPRTIVRTSALADANLLSAGTLFETKYRLALPEGTDLEALKVQANEGFADTGLRWRDARNGAPRIARFVDRLSTFLILVGLSGLAVGGVGISAAVRAYLASKTSVIATLRTLGATRATVFQTYFLQIGALSLVGIIVGLIVGAALPLLVAPLIAANLPIPISFGLFAGPLVQAAIYGVLTALIFTLWPLARTEDVRAATLFRDALSSSKALPAPRFVLATLILVALLLAAAIGFSGAMWLTLWAALGIAGALAILVVAAWGICRLSKSLTGVTRGKPALRWALSSIAGAQQGASAVVLSLGLGLSVLAAVGQIDGNLRSAIARDLPDIAPSYFFVDIQRDQMPAFTERLESDDAVSRIDSAPMLRGVITQINGQPAREVAGSHWVVRGDRGVTYSAKLPERTRITAGAWWPEDYSGPPQISFAAEEAEELGLQLGDTLTVNILGRDITGTITSFREVDFSTAGIGFVVAMNPAALAGAPHSFISTVYAEEAAEAQIMRDIGKLFPNITGIRVRDAIDQVTGMLAGIAAAISYGAGATLLTGFLVLIGAAASGEQARTYEAAVLKTLGARRSRILQSFALRAAILGAGAGIVALAAGVLGGWTVSVFVMETDFEIIWANAIAIILGGIAATTVAGLAFAWSPLAAKPASVLRARE